jgi:hypothetical protein
LGAWGRFISCCKMSSNGLAMSNTKVTLGVDGANNRFSTTLLDVGTAAKRI